MTSGSHTPRERADRSSRPPARRRDQIRQLVAGAGTALVVIFGLVNLDKVKVDWIVTTGHTPLIVVIAFSFLLGAIAGAVFWRRRVGR
jgi:uncharacterized integral membrane protein